MIEGDNTPMMSGDKQTALYAGLIAASAIGALVLIRLVLEKK